MGLVIAGIKYMNQPILALFALLIVIEPCQPEHSALRGRQARPKSQTMDENRCSVACRYEHVRKEEISKIFTLTASRVSTGVADSAESRELNSSRVTDLDQNKDLFDFRSDI